MGLPALIGAGVGGGLNLIRGKNPLQGALLGGAGGALTGGISNFMNTGSLLGANAVGAEVAKNAALSAAGTAPSVGMVFNPATGTWLNPEYYVGAGSPLATYTGGEGLISNALGDISIPQSIKDYATPQNLLGVTQLATTSNQAPLQNIGSGQVSRGQIPQYVPYNVGEVQSWKKRGQA
jgi:hypothetical protein